jgi:hypothetical protein
MERFARFGLIAGLVGGLLLAVGAGLLATSSDPMSAQAVTTPFVAGGVLRLAGGIGMVLGVSGLTALCAPRGRTLLFGGYVLAVAGLVLNLGWIWADVFVSDTLAKVAPEVLDGTGVDLGTRLDAGFLAAWLANLGLALLALGVALARVVSRWSWLALGLGGVITLVPMPFDGPVYEVVIGGAVAVSMGMALAGRTRTTEPTPAVEEAMA